MKAVCCGASRARVVEVEKSIRETKLFCMSPGKEYIVHVRALIQLNHPIDKYFDQFSGKVSYDHIRQNNLPPSPAKIKRLVNFLHDMHVYVYMVACLLCEIFYDTCRLALNCL